MGGQACRLSMVGSSSPKVAAVRRPNSDDAHTESTHGCHHEGSVVVHFLNCFSCSAYYPSHWQTGTLCLLVGSSDGLILVDTGPGLEDYANVPAIICAFQLVTKVPLNPEEAALRQITRLGFKVEDVRNVVLTHMHFDHCGGLPDFLHARIHVHEGEYRAFVGPPRRWTDLAYVRRHIAHKPNFAFYSESGDRWFDFGAIRLPFGPEMWLIPLFGHSRGHCGVAIKTDGGWLFHVADAGPLGLGEDVPQWLTRLVVGPHTPRLRQFKSEHPEMLVTTSHTPLDFFSANTAAGVTSHSERV
jgi:glyoxylase-like metal-dependent hydrolase (beta-lactamase superfamily II)